MEKTLKTLPGVRIDPLGGLDWSSGPYVRWWDDTTAILDGEFTIEQLREIANYMSRNIGKED